MGVERAAIGRTTTKLPPCAVQIHPRNGKVVIVGTYKLEEASRTRHGSLDIYTIDEDGVVEEGVQGEGGLKLVNSYATKSSILDVKIDIHNDSLVWTAQSTGNIILWKYDHDNGATDEVPALTRVKSFQLFDDDVLVLSLAQSAADRTLMSATLTTGEVAVLKVSPSDVQLQAVAQSHSLEAWISSFGEEPPLENVLFSGGDDSMLVAHDLRTLGAGDDLSPLWTRRLHEAGITSILPPGKFNSTLWTGGYDDKLKSIDLRNNGTKLESYMIPRPNWSKDLGGGVWRLIPNESQSKLLACCMYGGAKILTPASQLSPEPEQAPIVAEYITEGHESMVYGGDWSGNIVATCSFYDRQLQLHRTSAY